MANSLYELTKGIPKILLTATPMQNTLLDIYGLVQFIDDRVFYSKQIFSERYLRGEDYNDLKACLEPVVQRTLRKEVAEYIQFSERKEMTIDFELSPMEIELYVMINNYLKKEILYALPNSHRTLITSVIRKLLASSSMAVAETFKVLKGRLETLKETTRTESADESIDFFLSFFDDDEIETDDDSKQDELYTREKVNEFIQHEIDEVTAIINKAESIKRNAKMTALKQAVETAFAFQDEAGIKQRIVVFTESIRTQAVISWLRNHLSLPVFRTLSSIFLYQYPNSQMSVKHPFFFVLSLELYFYFSRSESLDKVDYFMSYYTLFRHKQQSFLSNIVRYYMPHL